MERLDRRPGYPGPEASADSPHEIRARAEATDVTPEVERKPVEQRRRPTDADERIRPGEVLRDVRAALRPVEHAGGGIELAQEPHVTRPEVDTEGERSLAIRKRPLPETIAQPEIGDHELRLG